MQFLKFKFIFENGGDRLVFFFGSPNDISFSHKEEKMQGSYLSFLCILFIYLLSLAFAGMYYLY